MRTADDHTPGKSPLYAAAEGGFADVSVIAALEEGRSVSSELDVRQIVEQLLKFGANVRQETFRQKTPLYPAAELGHVNVRLPRCAGSVGLHASARRW